MISILIIEFSTVFDRNCASHFECDGHINFVAFPASVLVIYQILLAAEIKMLLGLTTTHK